MKITNREIGLGKPCFVIAEIGQAHDGSLGTAHAYIDAVANAGVDAIKFQTHIAQAESTPLEVFRVNFSRQDISRYAYWQRMEFTPEQWRGLVDHAHERGLIFLSSAFSDQAVDLLENLGCPAWKIGSGEVTSIPLLRRMASTKKPILLSSGMSSWIDIENAIHCIQDEGAEVALLQCNTVYPCPPERWGLNVMEEMRKRFHCPIGFSDHSGNIYSGLAAVALGANLLEVHVTFSHECFGPDVSSSVTTSDLKRLVDGTRQIELSLAHAVNKDTEAEKAAELRILFGKSVVAARDMPAGTVIKESDLAFKKPGTGIPAAKVDLVLGAKLARPVFADTLLAMSDLVIGEK
jgi:N,N'-diacetyllegionaminate synthase